MRSGGKRSSSRSSVHTLSDITCRGPVGAAATDKGSANADRIYTMKPARAFEDIFEDIMAEVQASWRHLAQAHDDPEEERRPDQAGEYAELHFRTELDQAGRHIRAQQEKCPGQCSGQQYAAGLMTDERAHQMRRHEAHESDGPCHGGGCTDGECRSEYREQV